MDTIMWILFCLCATVGVVQLGAWLWCMLIRPPKKSAGYYVIILPREAAELEAELRYCLMCRRWGVGPERCLLLVDLGLDDEGHKICNKMLENVCDVRVCTPAELDGIVLAADGVPVKEG